MLDTLLESRNMKSRSTRGTLVSGAIHLGLIALATYLTTSRAAATTPEERIISIPFVKTAPAATQPAPRATSMSPTASSRVATPRQISVSIDVPTGLPAVTLELGAVRTDDFPAPSRGAGTGVPAAVSRAEGEPYTAVDVDTQVRAIAGSGFPQYPASLRAAGIEGQVVAQFTVDENGRAVAESIRITSSTNDLFSAAVKNAVVRMRFAPAQLAGKKVRQTVQQLFVFKLDR